MSEGSSDLPVSGNAPTQGVCSFASPSSTPNCPTQSIRRDYSAGNGPSISDNSPINSQICDPGHIYLSPRLVKICPVEKVPSTDPSPMDKGPGWRAGALAFVPDKAKGRGFNPPPPSLDKTIPTSTTPYS